MEFFLVLSLCYGDVAVRVVEGVRCERPDIVGGTNVIGGCKAYC